MAVILPPDVDLHLRMGSFLKAIGGKGEGKRDRFIFPSMPVVRVGTCQIVRMTDMEMFVICSDTIYS